ncbi:hypothetical protein NOZE110980_02420 [Nocardioides zeicaulis]
MGVAVVLPFLLGAAAGDGPAAGRPVLRFEDADVVESSGLALVDGLLVTTNDSGDSGRVFAVDPATGRTVGVTSWTPQPEDVEALAPAGDGDVWVADTGDNRHVRDSVEVLRVPVGRGERDAAPESYELVYPDGARDAEALLAHPVTGQLFVVTKGVFAGTVYAAPLPLRADRPNRLEEVAQAPGIVTDASFLPGGGALVLRTYANAHAVAYPSWESLGSWALPAQDQGEGITVAADELWLSTEGARSQVLAVDLPRLAAAADLAGPRWSVWRWLATARGLPIPAA